MCVKIHMGRMKEDIGIETEEHRQNNAEAVKSGGLAFFFIFLIFIFYDLFISLFCYYNHVVPEDIPTYYQIYPFHTNTHTEYFHPLTLPIAQFLYASRKSDCARKAHILMVG